MDRIELSLSGASDPLASHIGYRVEPQAGDFYGGWITSRIVGPFKGPPGTFGW